MQKIKLLSTLTVILSLLYCFSSLKTHADSDNQYPKDIIERQQDKIGSILDNQKFKSKILTKKNIKTNKIAID
jgi:hypothetical protein